MHFEYLGILDSNHTTFDLGNFNKHLGYVNIHIESGHIDLVTVSGNGTSLYAPSFGYYLSLPHKKNDVEIFFFNDCHYNYDCYTHCFFNKLNFDQEDSCMVGCDLFDFHRNCHCLNYDFYEVPFFGNHFRLDDCHEGCYYEVNHRYYPDYILLPNEIGLHRDIMSSNECENGNLTCYNEIINKCTNSESCASVSVDHMTSYNSPRHERTNESIFLLKNKVWTTTSSTTGTETTTTETDTTYTHTSTTKTDTTNLYVYNSN